MSSARAGRRAWVGLAVLAFVPFLLSLDLSVLFLALPSLSADLHTSSLELLWIGDIYAFVLAACLVPMGALGDRFGRKRLMLIGAAVFGVASIVAAYSVNPEMLIATRGVLGVAGAMMLPNALALVTEMFPEPKQRQLAIGIYVSCFMGGTAVGPAVGGLLLSTFWWGSAFLIGTPVMVALLAAGPLTIPEVRNPRAARVDLPSMALVLVAVLSLVHGLKDVARNGIATDNIVFLVIGLAVGLVFVRRQLGLAVPMLDLRLFRTRPFTVGLLFMMFGSLVMAGTLLLTSQYLQQVLGLSPGEAGLWSVPAAGTLVLASLLAPVLARRFTAARVMIAGVAVAVVGFLVLTQVSGGDLALLVAGLILVQGGIGVCGPLGTDFVLGAAPTESAGAVTGLSQTCIEMGSAFGIAGLGTAAAVVYESVMQDSPVPAARDNLPGALQAAGRLDPSAAGELVTQARGAYTSGMHLAAAISAGITVLLVGAAVSLAPRRQRAERAPAPQPSE
ncbi:MFS transporter [Amycolatopsis sp. OK19-0408]|uniref:MFS transporter n=1 Tax=Amycolatopsis iheyensis TaxID=2945988 RepID=A0A9X2N8Z7_9PSEU|nr:MFS transporter [Amycolatopsis iheyensis]MCR6483492.1 MFS transporter [Amycolatopsis iheyensis]